jgi:hypothetical protein
MKLKLETTHIRKGKTLRPVEDDAKTYESVNAAKRESWKIQGSGTRLGFGEVQVVRR